LDGLSGRQECLETNVIGKDCRWSGCRANGNPPIHTIQTLIPERKAVLGRDGIQVSTSPTSYLPTDFEQVGKIRFHREGETERNGKMAIVVHTKALEAEAFP
jgi:hypothetical protein